MIKSKIKDYLSVSKKEWNGLVILVILILLVLAAPYVYQLFYKDNTINLNDFNAAVALLDKAKPGDTVAGGRQYGHVDKKPGTAGFDPNHLPEKQWKDLGLNDRQIAIIRHFEAKGGKFFTKSDLRKIYSITPEDYKRLAPYLNLPDSDYRRHKLAPGEFVELNTADSARLTKLNGIGPAYARRIIGYRKRLGGFCRKEQIKEVFGIDDDKYADLKNQVKVDAYAIKKIHINQVDFDGIKNFPYLSFKQIEAIISYRDQHGDYESVADLRNIAIIDAVLFRKIAPYMTVK
jgi:competence ComEA-like helix-hairpin-helix protein